jgi:hypothetical protein
MADKGTTVARRSRPAYRVVSRSERNRPHSGRNKVYVALPFSRITAQEPMPMKVGDWVSLAGLVTSVIGFSVVIRQLIRIANASEADQASDRVNREDADSLAGQSSSSGAGRLRAGRTREDSDHPAF